ncbi:DUF421 domain-containing protein [Parvularcula maris]|uniref:DUF421 domain-containing protein n=1 Tax=Parvularcula maris TaxID=2965077 RepID=A0A9X2L800_9PROT|nr:YetF domain-containing protein [Parvularcula maris]MCQ8184631.1 DUF421 domain-containing protein [Parvularcula maris]
MDEKERIFFADWEGIAEVVIVSPLIYGLVILFVRISGKRTTGEMNNFDWILTVAMGSIVASGIVINTVELAETVSAIAVLIGLQYILTKLTHRSSKVSNIVKSPPRVLVYRGVIDEKAMQAERITKEEIAAVLRQNDIPRLDAIEFLVLENTGQFSILSRVAAEASVDEVVMTEEMRNVAQR